MTLYIQVVDKCQLSMDRPMHNYTKSTYMYHSILMSIHVKYAGITTGSNTHWTNLRQGRKSWIHVCTL